MRVLFDHQIFSSQIYGGVSKYFAEMIHRLPPECDWDITTWLSNNEYASNYNLYKSKSFLKHNDFRGKGRLMSILGNPYSAYRLLKKDYDVFHPTNFNMYYKPFVGKKPIVVTYHDTNFVTSYDKNERRYSLQKKALARANMIITISQNTKSDILKFFDIVPDKIKVVYHGVSKIDIADIKGKRIHEKPYVLYVGLRHGYKNFKKFAEAFSLLSKKNHDIDLICTRKQFSYEENEFLRKLDIREKSFVYEADEKTLARLYNDALFFVFPSLYEGFGMPILEAMINECPVILSNASCFPEIAQNAGLYFDPLSVDDILEKMEMVVSSNDLRMSLIEKGNLRVKKFTWEACAKQHYEVYNSLV